MYPVKDEELDASPGNIAWLETLKKAPDAKQDFGTAWGPAGDF